MAVEVARYQFHSWSRKGISTRIEIPDDLGEGGSTLTERVEVSIPVKLNATPLSKDFVLIGPGDIIGINRDMIVRTEPLNRITNAEPNYLAFIEFYDEDFAWRYTPAAPVFPGVSPATVYKPSRLRPWVFLLVLKDDEFELSERRVPLPSINIKTGNAFPPANETWLWAHVHSNADIPRDEFTDQEAFLASLNTSVDDDPDQLYCRLMSPRKLEANMGYTAFLVPAFETGRLAGLSQSTTGINSQLPAWADDSEALEMPVYYQWSFRTGADADFESLVKKLKPQAMDPRVGIRDMDCHTPGFVKTDGTDFPAPLPEIIGLEGALKSPDTVSTVYPAAEAGEFPQALEEIINLPIDIRGTNDAGDPVISLPLYGGKHAKKSVTDVVRFEFSDTSWLHDLNKDPRTRVAAGFGTLVLQKNQERYMSRAWEQVTNIIKANRMIRLVQFQMMVAMVFTRKTFSRLPETVLLAMSRPVLSRVMGSPTTVYQQLKESRLPAAVFSGAFRRAVRPANTKKLTGDGAFNFPALITALNEGKLSAAPPRQAPAGAPTTRMLADKIFSDNLPAWLKWVMANRLLLLIGLLLLIVVLALVTAAYIVLAVMAAAVVAGYLYVNKISRDQDIAQILIDPEKELAMINAVPARPAFTLRLSDEKITPAATVTSASTDSVEGAKFRKALTDLTKRFVVKAPEKEILPLNMANAYKKVSEAIHPGKSFAKRLSGFVKFNGELAVAIKEPEKIFPAMAYPDFEDPMYKKLTEISDELLLPNLKLIPDNCISLLETNPKFIESYLVGLNHEMGRELLWREYPTDERGSYFRQFWDVKGITRPAATVAEQISLAESLKDIKAIDTWSTDSLLGMHNNRSAAGGSPEKLVLVIRGELLKQYPEAVIFCQKAVAGASADQPDIIQGLTNEQFIDHVKFPLFKAEISPDIKFFGFDMTIEQARGEVDVNPFTGDRLGWFFCIAQPPGEARFGMDISYNAGTDGDGWDDLAWTNFDAAMNFISKTIQPDIPLSNTEKNRWCSDAASMADILFQKPSMVAVHAKQMLAELTN